MFIVLTVYTTKIIQTCFFSGSYIDGSVLVGVMHSKTEDVQTTFSVGDCCKYCMRNIEQEHNRTVHAWTEFQMTSLNQYCELAIIQQYSTFMTSLY